MRKLTVVALAVALAGCGISKEKYSAKEAEALKYKQALDEESTRGAAQVAKITDLEQKLKGCNDALAKTDAAKAEAEAAASALAAKSAQYERLNQSLKSQISAGQIEISELRGRMTVKLKDQILFASGSATLGKDGLVALDAVAEAFKELQGKNVIVAGYTDDVPTGRGGAFKDNWDLSSARAAAVVRYLQGKGIDPKMLGAVGFSQYRPVAPNDTPANKSLNRRIEIALTAADYTPPVLDTSKK
jgi:chemotaxis protein MotB